MDTATFQRILTAFVDRPADIDLSRGRLLVQVRDELIEATLAMREGSLHVDESAATWTAEQWIIQRLARLPLLADRIVSLLPAEPHFIVPGGRLLDELDRDPTEEEKRVPDVLSTADEFLGRRVGGTASVLYLTADAGEGKSTVITELARRKADEYRRKASDWLLLPISLAGRPFLRFDDITVAALVNRLRFPYLYYDAFIELVRLGVVVPAYDGFEEMFIEGSTGEAVSALGTLMQGLESAGALLIAARQAYFDYRRMETQAKLFDTLGGRSVGFSRLKIERWDRSRFVAYGQKRGIGEAEDLYEAIAVKIGPEHPLLTRAILVKRLLDLADEGGSIADMLERLSGTPTEHFSQFVRAIISREAHKNWIDTSGEPARPLISEDEHEELLATVAREMWTAGTEVLRDDVMDFAAEDFCETHGKSVANRRQIIERLKQHALITRQEGVSNLFAFDHVEFYHYSLGSLVAHVLKDGRVADIRQVLRRGQLSHLAADVAATKIAASGKSREALTALSEAARQEGAISFISENAGILALLVIDRSHVQGAVVQRVTMPADALRGKRLLDTVFVECYFQPCEVEVDALRGARFTQCEFEQLTLRDVGVLADVSFIDCRVRAIVPPESEDPVFAPEQVRAILSRAGATVVQQEMTVETQADVVVLDDALKVATRTLRAFRRATEINEATLRIRAGAQASYFENRILPELLKAGVLRAVPYHGAGVQRRFRLDLPFHDLSKAVERCGGSFEGFVAIVKAEKRHV